MSITVETVSPRYMKVSVLSPQFFCKSKKKKKRPIRYSLIKIMKADIVCEDQMRVSRKKSLEYYKAPYKGI